MEQSDRDKIQMNLVTLSKLVNVPQIANLLINKGVIDREFVERTEKFPTTSQKNQEFFLMYTKRGPTAFRHLVDTLRETGHISEAHLLAGTGSEPQLSQMNNRGVLPVPRPHHPQVGRSSSLESPSESESVSSSEGNSAERTLSETPESSTSTQSSRGSGEGVIIEAEKKLPATLSTANGLHNILPNNAIRDLSLTGGPVTAVPTPPASPINRKPIKRATQYNQGKTSDEEAYPMMSKPRGFALIMNNIDFPNDPNAKRTGAEHDSENLRLLCQDLGFHTTVRHNVTRNDLKHPTEGILRKFRDQFLPGHEDVDACLVAIMSHGTGNLIRTSDPGDTYIDLKEEIIKPFNNSFCRQLINKPKIFIVQACRGDSRDRGAIRTEQDGKIMADIRPQSPPGNFCPAPTNGSGELLPSNEDILVCYSTVPGYVANRDTERGTWYINCLVEAFREHAHELEIHGLLRKVGLKMRSVNNEYGDEKQMSAYEGYGFHRELYFNPGLYGNSNDEQSQPSSSQ